MSCLQRWLGVLSILLLIVPLGASASNDRGDPAPFTEVQLGPDFLPAGTRVRGEFACDLPEAGRVSGHYEYRRDVGSGIEASRSNRIVSLSFRGREVSSSVIEGLNAEGGGILNITVSCRPDGQRVRWFIRYWRTSLVSPGSDGYVTVIVETDTEGNEVRYPDDEDGSG